MNWEGQSGSDIIWIKTLFAQDARVSERLKLVKGGYDLQLMNPASTVFVFKALPFYSPFEFTDVTLYLKERYVSYSMRVPGKETYVRKVDFSQPVKREEPAPLPIA